MKRNHKSNKGMGMLALLVGCVFVVLATIGLNQRLASNLTRQRELVSSGRKAFALAESAIAEALLSFRRQMNEPSDEKDSWYQLIRKPITDDYGCIEEKSFVPMATRAIHSQGVLVEKVKMSLWLQQPVNKVQRDKQALLTLTAIVQVPRRNGFLGTYIVRNLQKSYEFKLSHLTTPSPLNAFTLFVGSYEHLRGCSEGYAKYRKSYEEREKQQEKLLDGDMEYWRDAVSRKQKEAQNELNNLAPYMSNPGLRSAVEQGLNSRGLSISLLENIAKTKPSGWMAAAGYHTDFADPKWPSFRNDDNNLSNHAFVRKQQVRGEELTMSLPQFPNFPAPHPSTAIPGDATKWDWPTLSCLSTPFANWIAEKDRTAKVFEQSLDKELRRQEKLINLVKNRDRQKFLDVIMPRTHPFHWRAKASYIFSSQEELVKFLQGKDGRFHLDGVCFVDGSLALDNFTYVGKGTIVATGDVTLDGAVGSRDSLLTVVSKKDIYLGGFVRAALLAPLGTVHFAGNAVNGTVLEWHHRDNDFNIKYDKRHSAKIANHYCNLSPYAVACSLVRKQS